MSSSILQAKSLRLLLLSVIAAAACSSSGQTYDANADFSISNGNPNNVWGYGFTPSLGGVYTPYTMNWSAVPGVIDSWNFDPSVQKNVTNSHFAYGSVRWQPYQMTMHPGPNGEYSVLRFKAANCGSYQFAAQFIGQDVVGTTTDVYVLHNGTPVWSGSINGYLNTSGGAGIVEMECGDTLDVVVGTGSNGTYFFDTTGVEFRVQGVSLVPSEFQGFLAPVGGADSTGGNFYNTVRTFKLGSTIPFKFRAYCCDRPILTGIHTLQGVKFSSYVDADPPIDATPSDAATTGNQFRLTGDTWHFNLDTHPLSAGTWKITATLSDGSQHFVWITLKP